MVSGTSYLCFRIGLELELPFLVRWRVTGEHHGSGTRSLLISTDDKMGVQYVITAPVEDDPEAKRAKVDTVYRHFHAHDLERFFKYHKGAQVGFLLGTPSLSLSDPSMNECVCL